MGAREKRKLGVEAIIVIGTLLVRVHKTGLDSKKHQLKEKIIKVPTFPGNGTD